MRRLDRNKLTSGKIGLTTFEVSGYSNSPLKISRALPIQVLLSGTQRRKQEPKLPSDSRALTPGDELGGSSTPPGI